ncbi:MAG: hypothetical protein JSS95_05030 [Acidobacteria bacterium]|nr:hypothetical protein [Acidobacteriota bacterium]
MPTASRSAAPFSQHRTSLPVKLHPAPRAEEAVLTIHRRSRSHHGATLQTLGHAAEHLAARSFAAEATDAGDREATHILMRLSREVFDDYVRLTRQRHPVADWIMGQAVRVYGAA